MSMSMSMCHVHVQLPQAVGGFDSYSFVQPERDRNEIIC